MKSLIQASVILSGFLLAMAFSIEQACAQPAPGLSSMRVVAVASPLYKNGTAYETITVNDFATPSDHGGNWLIVVVEERGYANAQFASLAGVSMKLSKSEPLVGFDRKIYGYLRYYTYEKPFNSGRFNCSASSIAFPWGTRTTTLNIR